MGVLLGGSCHEGTILDVLSMAAQQVWLKQTQWCKITVIWQIPSWYLRIMMIITATAQVITIARPLHRWHSCLWILQYCRPYEPARPYKHQQLRAGLTATALNAKAGAACLYVNIITIRTLLVIHNLET